MNTRSHNARLQEPTGTQRGRAEPEGRQKLKIVRGRENWGRGNKGRMIKERSEKCTLQIGDAERETRVF
jgi:hypothetical protein